MKHPEINYRVVILPASGSFARTVYRRWWPLRLLRGMRVGPNRSGVETTVTQSYINDRDA